METWNTLRLLGLVVFCSPHQFPRGALPLYSQPLQMPLTNCSLISLLLILSAHCLCVFRGLYCSLDCWLSLFVLLSTSWNVKKWLGCPVSPCRESSLCLGGLLRSWVHPLVSLNPVPGSGQWSCLLSIPSHVSSPVPGPITSAQQMYEALGRSYG